MTVNRERPHLLVLPEDGADRSLANGFMLGIDQSRQRSMQVLPEAGGWLHVFEVFTKSYAASLRRYHQGHMVLLIDFDGDVQSRSQRFKNCVPEDLVDRVYLLGTRDEPEDLRRSVGLKIEGSCAVV